MLLDEAKAKAKFCALIGANCKGSGCMQWRTWLDTATAPSYDDKRMEELKSRGYRVIAARAGDGLGVFDLVKPTDAGYCGLAGKPGPFMHNEPSGEQQQ